MSGNFLTLVLIIALSVVGAQLISRRLFAKTPKQEIVERTTSGNTVQDFLDRY